MASGRNGTAMTTVRSGTKTTSGLEMARAKHALDAAGLDPTIALTRASSVTNEVWLSDEFAVRVNRRPDKRLWREARLGPAPARGDPLPRGRRVRHR